VFYETITVEDFLN